MHCDNKSFLHSVFVYYSLICPFSSHVMKELIATERIYVDELLSVLLVSFMAFCFC